MKLVELSISNHIVDVINKHHTWYYSWNSTSAPNERVSRITQLAKFSFNHPSVVFTADVLHNISMGSAAMRGNMSFVHTGRIGQWDDYKLGSGSYVRTGRRITRKRQYRTNTHPDTGDGLRRRSDINQVGFQAVKPTVGKALRTLFVLEVFRSVL